MASCSAPPARGEFVELRCGAQLIIAQVVWVRHGRFGARVRDRLDLSKLVPGLRPSPPRQPGLSRPARFQVIKPDRHSIAEQAAASRRQARLIDFAAVSAAGAALALLVAGTVHEALGRPFGQITVVLSAN